MGLDLRVKKTELENNKRWMIWREKKQQNENRAWCFDKERPWNDVTDFEKGVVARLALGENWRDRRTVESSRHMLETTIEKTKKIAPNDDVFKLCSMFRRIYHSGFKR